MVLEFYTTETALSYSQERAFKTFFNVTPQLVDVMGAKYSYRCFLYGKGSVQNARAIEHIKEHISPIGNEIKEPKFL